MCEKSASSLNATLTCCQRLNNKTLFEYIFKEIDFCQTNDNNTMCHYIHNLFYYYERENTTEINNPKFTFGLQLALKEVVEAKLKRQSYTQFLFS